MLSAGRRAPVFISKVSRVIQVDLGPPEFMVMAVCLQSLVKAGGFENLKHDRESCHLCLICLMFSLLFCIYLCLCGQG